MAARAAAQTNVWTQRNLVPPPRVGAAFLDQPARHRVLLFGGWAGDQGVRSDTWEWDGFGWLRRVPLNDPGRRFAPGSAYDDVGKRVLVYGGIKSFQPAIVPADNDTWEWNGAEWTAIVTAHAPGELAGSSCAWDAANRRMLLFGGFVQTEQPTRAASASGFWAFDGKDWKEVPRTEPWPTPRGFGTMAFDAQGHLVLHGGFNQIAFKDGNIDFDAGISYVNDTWEWDGASWRLLPAIVPGGALGGASGPAMALEPDTKQLVLYVDGYLESPMYALDATKNWVPVQTRPADRTFSLATWSSANNAMLVSGGLLAKDGRPTAVPIRGEERGSSTLPWSAFRAQARPGIRQSAASVAFPSGVAVVFGGIPAEGAAANDDTYVWTGGAWTLARTGATKPAARHSAAMALLGPTRAVLFGGRSGSTRFDDTWIWNAENESWTLDARTTPRPSKRELHAMATAGGVVVLYGGTVGGNGGALGDTWTYTEADGWKQLTLPVSPGLRHSAFTSESLDGKSALFYGGAAPEVSAADLWSFADGIWSKAGDFGGLGRRRGGLVRDVRARRLYLAGGGGSSGLGEIWDVTAPPGVELATNVFEDNEEAPLRRNSHVVAENPLTGGFLYYGGQSAQADESLDDTWQFRQLGGACTTAEQCGVGLACTDGVCCETSSCGPCRTCAGASTPGLCTARGVFGPEAGCDGPGQACSLDGHCRLADEETCSDDRACASNTCLVAGRDAGVCCQAAGCATRCIDGALRGPDGTTTSCGNFGCDGQGCKTSCAVLADCAAGAVCNDRRECVQPGSNAATDSGCSCRVTGLGTGTTGWLVGMAALVLGLAARARASSCRRE